MTRDKIIFFGILTAALLLALLYFFLWPQFGPYFPKCIFNRLTGLYCPGCGSQRAVAALLDLKFDDALHDNLLTVAAIPFLIFAFSSFFLKAFYGKRATGGLFYNPSFSKIVLIVVIVFFALRNIPVFPFSLLAPL